MSKRGERRKKKLKEVRRRPNINNNVEYFDGLEYCCNLDDDEYNCLWECYDVEEQSLLDQIINFFKRIFNCLLV